MYLLAAWEWPVPPPPSIKSENGNENINECSLCVDTIGDFWSGYVLLPGLFDQDYFFNKYLKKHLTCCLTNDTIKLRVGNNKNQEKDHESTRSDQRNPGRLETFRG